MARLRFDLDDGDDYDVDDDGDEAPHQDSLDLELGASASRVAPHPPPTRRRSSGLKT